MNETDEMLGWVVEDIELILSDKRIVKHYYFQRQCQRLFSH